MSADQERPKRCRVCGELKPAEEFYFNNRILKWRRNICRDCDNEEKANTWRRTVETEGRMGRKELAFALKTPMPWPREIEPPDCGCGVHRCESCGPELIELCQARVAAVLPVACEFMDGFDMLKLELMA